VWTPQAYVAMGRKTLEEVLRCFRVSRRVTGSYEPCRGGEAHERMNLCIARSQGPVPRENRRAVRKGELEAGDW